MKATREELSRELTDIEVALSMNISFRARQVLLQQREELFRQIKRRRSWWQRWWGR